LAGKACFGASFREEIRPVKTGKILDQDTGGFALEYDNTRGTRNSMRLDATTYERAICEAKSFLGIKEDDYDEDGFLWEIE
jgi:hypothetical protein